MTSSASSPDTTQAWSRLEATLDAWGSEGRVATFWLRDDDACHAGPRLEQLLSILDGAPLGLAVIPGRADRSLFDRLREATGVRVLPHGYTHTNHAPAGEKKSEFGPHRPLADMLQEIRQSWSSVMREAPDCAVPVFVPPWNRIDPRLAGRLPEAGLHRLSVYGSANDGSPHYLNTHVDIIDWHGSRGFVGERAALGGLVSHLDRRKNGGRDSPTGILTHHRDHDSGCWRFLRALVEMLNAHPAARWVDPAGLAGQHE